jgi:hypothetical protein
VGHVETASKVQDVLVQFCLLPIDLILVCHMPNSFQFKGETACISGYLWG